jgi:hypothetical protein
MKMNCTQIPVKETSVEFSQFFRGSVVPAPRSVIDGIKLFMIRNWLRIFYHTEHRAIRKGSVMRFIERALKPTSILLVIIFVLAPAFYRSTSAAMIGTETVLTPARNPDTRAVLRGLMARADVQQVLVARGIDPREAIARIDSLSDDELEIFSEFIADKPAGGSATGFIVVVGVVIIIVIIIVEYFSEVKMFPELYSDE